MENLKIKSTAQPPEQLTYEQWKKEFLPGARLNNPKPNMSFAPLETFINSINKQFAQRELQTI